MSGSRSGLIGRPREFDPEEALERAVRVFWEQGYEGTSLTDLTGAMGVSKPSLYAAFGNKEQLFQKALERYTAGPGSYAARALQQPTARGVAEALLRGAVEATTHPHHPHGCMGVQAALATGDGGRPAHDTLVEWRNATGVDFEARFRRAVEEGDLPSDIDPASLARYLTTVGFGIAVQAASGVGRAELQDVVDIALLSWPGPPSPELP
ncbi:TetR/AcrR family transcriptional regulator [Microbacterium caowuchunii]|uniref:TetR/AcrR family transcriptional regulator n=1 Tax=Microbacterium caowuchunii TaxID=2614638 RepID=A0A5N0TLJ9_9MICO|nr:TetR/AcrR family transcriptional regulator [Microbacterium caowuchunii]KAA9135970.1 TetR/AcrR family transcriptional regulator [Microbacterium caowuchunii]